VPVETPVPAAVPSAVDLEGTPTGSPDGNVLEGRWQLTVSAAEAPGCVRVNPHVLEITIERVDDDTFIEHSPVQDSVFELQPDSSWVYTMTDENRGRHTLTTTIRFDGDTGEGQRVFTSVRLDLTTCDIVVPLRYDFLGE
jgi:hypothetical protein